MEFFIQELAFLIMLFREGDLVRILGVVVEPRLGLPCVEARVRSAPLPPLGGAAQSVSGVLAAFDEALATSRALWTQQTIGDVP